MKVEFTKESIKDLKNLNQKQQKLIKSKIDELKKSPTAHKDSKLIQIRNRQIYRIKIREERNGEIDHRAIYNIKNGRIIIYSIFHRDTGYIDEEIAERLQEG